MGVDNMNDAGKITFIPCGSYNNDTTYDFLDVVTFGNSSYIAKKLTKGNEPNENNEYWQILVKNPDGIVTGIKGNKETNFRSGDVNITPENIGALPSDGNAVSADKISEKRTIDGVEFDGSSEISHYGTCTTKGSINEKQVSIPGFLLKKGAIITVYFENKNTSINTTLNINETGANPIRYNGSAISNTNSGIIYGCCEFAYNGSYWYLVNANITPENIGLGNVDNTADKDKDVSNADTVDGKHSSDFAASAHTHTSTDVTDKLDSTTASALSTSNKLVTERDVYHGLPKINNSHTYNSNTNIYAPTTEGKEGYELVGNGTSSAPVWKAPNFAVCTDSSFVSEKIVTIDNFKLFPGTNIMVQFKDGLSGDTGSSSDYVSRGCCTLNVSDTGEKEIRYQGSQYYNYGRNAIINMVYDGTYWNIIGENSILHSSENNRLLLMKNSQYLIRNWQIEMYCDVLGNMGKSFAPYQDPSEYNFSLNLGNSLQRWDNLYCKNSPTSTSDRNEKKEIKDISESYEKLFMLLQPKSFMFKDGDRIHIGAISQDVEDAMNEIGLSATDFGGFCKDFKFNPIYDSYGNPIYNEDGEMKVEYLYDEDNNPIYTYSLRYEEFIFLTIHMVQKNIKKIKELEERISSLEQLVIKN